MIRQAAFQPEQTIQELRLRNVLSTYTVYLYTLKFVPMCRVNIGACHKPDLIRLALHPHPLRGSYTISSFMNQKASRDLLYSMTGCFRSYVDTDKNMCQMSRPTCFGRSSAETSGLVTDFLHCFPLVLLSSGPRNSNCGSTLLKPLRLVVGILSADKHRQP